MFMLMTVIHDAGATHIVGGELNYKYLGNDSIYVKIKVYRDSLNADPYFDSPLSLYVYDSTNNFVGNYAIQIPGEKLIIPEIDDSCFVEPPMVLVDFVIYEDTLWIPGITPGYQFAYMRCCRNNAILNIEALDFITNDTVPGELTGAVYPAELPRSTLDNGNPEYNTFPPVAICANKQLNYDHSATDPDGDSLVYELCTPFTGGNATFVFGDPILQAPPFQEVLFVPPFGLDNVMGGTPLAIDPNSGLLTAVPNTLGRFVIAVCVNEYRDGDFLARHRRDFQFNVVDCSRVFDADYTISVAPKIDTLGPLDYLFCDTTLTKQFTAELVEPIPVLWDFDDGTTSTEINPLHTFPDTGTYHVTIIAGPGEVCADTMTKTIHLQKHIIGAAFDFEVDPCSVNRAEITFTDASTADEPIVIWEWDFGDGNSSNDQNPVHYYDEEDTFAVSLVIYAANGCCTQTESTLLLATALLDTTYLPDTIVSCDGDSARLTLEVAGENLYSWNPAAGLSDPTAQQPMAFPMENTQYVVTILTPTESGDTCIRTDTSVVLVEDIIPDIQIDTDTIICSSDVFIMASTDFAQPVSWIWSSNPEFTDTLALGPALDTVLESNEVTYYVQASSYWCSNETPVTIRKPFLDVIPQPIASCGSDALMVDFTVISPTDDYTLTWAFEDTVVTSNVPFDIQLSNPGTAVTVFGINDEGCTDEEVVTIDVYPLPEVEAVAIPGEVVSGAMVELFATNDSDYDYVWNPVSGLSDPSIYNPVAEVFVTTIFEVVVVDEHDCGNIDTALVVVVDVICDESNIFIPNAFSPNGDGLNDVFRPSGERIEGMTLVVYDRWGNKIYESTDASLGWDGTSDGKLLSADSYGYFLRVLCDGNATFEKIGNVTLVR